MALALLTHDTDEIAPAERALASCGFLLAFDVYGRASDIAKAQRVELRPPLRSQRGVATSWTLTLFPSNSTVTSKTWQQDETAEMGGSHPDRRWLQKLCPLMVGYRSSDPRLLAMEPARYQFLFRLARRLASLPPIGAHRLRHGGASADALLRGEQHVTDLALAARGRWASIASIKRYRQPVHYLRVLHEMPAAQRSLAASAPHRVPLLVRSLLSQPTLKGPVKTQSSKFVFPMP